MPTVLPHRMKTSPPEHHPLESAPAVGNEAACRPHQTPTPRSYWFGSGANPDEFTAQAKQSGL